LSYYFYRDDMIKNQAGLNPTGKNDVKLMNNAVTRLRMEDRACSSDNNSTTNRSDINVVGEKKTFSHPEQKIQPPAQGKNSVSNKS
jgi:hypothetical protein